LLVAVCEQQSGTIALASQNATASAIRAVCAHRRRCRTDAYGGATRSPERSGQRPPRFSHETGRDERCVVCIVIGSQRHDLRNRTLPIPNDDLFARSHFP
jgi:hypothetical protein